MCGSSPRPGTVREDIDSPQTRYLYLEKNPTGDKSESEIETVVVEDTNQDGHITKDEFIAMSNHKPLATQGELKQLLSKQYGINLDAWGRQTIGDTIGGLQIFKDHSFYRLKPNEITKDVIRTALEYAGKLGIRDVNSHFQRELLRQLYDLKGDAEFEPLKTRVMEAFQLTETEFQEKLEATKHIHFLC